MSFCPEIGEAVLALVMGNVGGWETVHRPVGSQGVTNLTRFYHLLLQSLVSDKRPAFHTWGGLM